MLNSRDINKLRPDVAANCHIFMYGSTSDESIKFLGIEDYWGNYLTI